MQTLTSYIHLCTHTYKLVYTNIHICMCVHLSTYMYMYMYRLMYVCHILSLYNSHTSVHAYIFTCIQPCAC